MKLLLHTCCGPCFLGVWEDLSQKDIQVTSYFYNPNIQPSEEYERRRKNLKRVSDSKSIKLLQGKYDPERHLAATSKQKDAFPARCRECYRLRLDETARKAKELNYDQFSTTLLVSPYQQHKWLQEVGEEMAAKHGVEFYYTDWRPHFRHGQDEARDMQLYRQKYCGCSYSLAESRHNQG